MGEGTEMLQGFKEFIMRGVERSDPRWEPYLALAA